MNICNRPLNQLIKILNKIFTFYRCNVADREEVLRVAKKVKEEVGDVTILINNAGIVFVKSFLNQSPDEIIRVIDVNVIAHYWVSNIFKISKYKLQKIQ